MGETTRGDRPTGVIGMKLLHPRGGKRGRHVFGGKRRGGKMPGSKSSRGKRGVVLEGLQR